MHLGDADRQSKSKGVVFFFFLNSSLRAQRLLQGKPWLGWSFRRGRAARGAAAGGRTARLGTQARALLCLAAAAGADLCPVLGVNAREIPASPGTLLPSRDAAKCRTATRAERLQPWSSAVPPGWACPILLCIWKEKLVTNTDPRYCELTELLAVPCLQRGEDTLTMALAPVLMTKPPAHRTLHARCQPDFSTRAPEGSKHSSSSCQQLPGHEKQQERFQPTAGTSELLLRLCWQEHRLQGSANLLEARMEQRLHRVSSCPC